MSKKILGKNIPGIGFIEYKAVSTKEELEGALSLVYKEYLARGFILPKFYRSPLRISLQNAIPETITLIALKDNKVAATCTLIPDSPLGLPMDQGYKDKLEKLRKSGRRICEVGQLAINSDMFGRGLFSMFNFRKLDFLFTLFKLIFQHALYYAALDDICIVTNPKYLIFKFLPFKIIGQTKYYGYDCFGLKKKAAVAKRLDLVNVKEVEKKRPGLAKMFLGEKLPREIASDRFRLGPKDLHYFFVEKSDLFEKANKQKLEYIRSCYGLTEDEFKAILKR